ncbi:MAG TPA: F0F1 ATP synthase subunit B [Bacteroidales bacterium]|jgi:F-type H+-transporting ATPase subunit b
MELVTPGIGLLFWMTLSFGLLLFVLGKYAWKPILKAIHEREDSIETALHSAEKAREDMLLLKADNEVLLKQAREERDAMLRDARKMKEDILEEARGKANEQGQRIIETARESIQFEKMAAITELKNQIAVFSIEIAEKVIEQELSDKEKQKKFTEKLIGKIKLS